MCTCNLPYLIIIVISPKPPLPDKKNPESLFLRDASRTLYPSAADQSSPSPLRKKLCPSPPPRIPPLSEKRESRRFAKERGEINTPGNRRRWARQLLLYTLANIEYTIYIRASKTTKKRYTYDFEVPVFERAEGKAATVAYIYVHAGVERGERDGGGGGGY